MKPELITFPNKIKLVLEDRPSKIVTIAVSLSVGAERETKKQAGICKLYEKTIAAPLKAQMANCGGIVSSRSNLENIDFSITVLRRHLKLALNALANTFFDYQPKLTTLKNAKVMVHQEVENTNANPQLFINLLARKFEYKGSGLAADSCGTAKSVEAITLADLQAFHKKYCTPECLSIAIVGDVADVETDTPAQNASAPEGAKPKVAKLSAPNEFTTKSFFSFLDEIADKDKAENKKTASATTSFKLAKRETLASPAPKPQTIIKHKVVGNINWDLPLVSPADKFDELIGDRERKFEEIHYLIVKYIYGRTLNLGKGKPRSTAYLAPSGAEMLYKYKNLNQTRVQIMLPSAPYASTGYKYSKLVETYLNTYLKNGIKDLSTLYDLSVKAKAYKNNAHLMIYFAVDAEDADEAYARINKLLFSLRAELVNKQEFEAIKMSYLTLLLKNFDSTLSLARQYNKRMQLCGEFFSIDKEIVKVQSLDYDSFVYVLKQMLNLECKHTVCLGKNKINEI